MREAEELKRRTTKSRNGKSASLQDHRQELEIKRLEDRLRRVLSTRVRIKPRAHGCTIEIQFFSADDLNRLLEFIDH